VARRSKMTDARVTTLLSALRAGNTRRAAAAHAGIDHATFYRWLADEATFRDAVEKAEAEADAEVRNVAIIAQAAPRSWQASAWWLERRRHDDYGQRKSIDFRIEVEEEVRRMATEFGIPLEAAMAEWKAMSDRLRKEGRG
jgi:hypothetical protein